MAAVDGLLHLRFPWPAVVAGEVGVVVGCLDLILPGRPWWRVGRGTGGS
jgi:hypothetical protein